MMAGNILIPEIFEGWLDIVKGEFYYLRDIYRFQYRIYNKDYNFISATGFYDTCQGGALYWMPRGQ